MAVRWPRPSATRAGWPRTTTKISTWFPGCFRGTLQQHFYNVYAYCRWADDLGDEVADPRALLELLDWWERELHLCYEGAAVHPVFIALADTIRARSIFPSSRSAICSPRFGRTRQCTATQSGMTCSRYCRYSANPVGRLVLYLCGYRDAERQRLSDATCTALQLANFWQDVSRDLEKGRIYIPLEALAAARIDGSGHRSAAV